VYVTAQRALQSPFMCLGGTPAGHRDGRTKMTADTFNKTYAPVSGGLGMQFVPRVCVIGFCV
jgi:hypothetical protein